MKQLDRENDMLFPIVMDFPKEAPVERETRKIEDALFSGIERTMPMEINFDGMLAPAHNQVYNGQGLGTCYAEAATGWIEYWVWRKCGKMIQFSREEIWDVAVDAKTMYGYDYRKNNTLKTIFSTGGSPNNVFTYGFKYNLNLGWHYFTDKQVSKNFQLFRELAEGCMLEKTFRTRSFTDMPFNVDVNSARENAMKILTEYGPFVYVSYTDNRKTTTHAWLAVGATRNGLLLRNSYGQDELVMDRWENVVKYATNGTWNCVPMIETKKF